MAKADIVVREDRTTIIGDTEITVGDGGEPTVDLSASRATLRLGGGTGQDIGGDPVNVLQSMTVSVLGERPRTDDGRITDDVYISALSPPEESLNDGQSPWADQVSLAMDAGDARVSVGSRREHGSISLLQAQQSRPSIEMARLDAGTATISVGAGRVGIGEPGTVTANNSYGLGTCELDAETATLTLGAGGREDSGDGGGGLTGGTDDDGIGGTDGVQEEPVTTPDGVDDALGSGAESGAIELVDTRGDTAGAIRLDDSGRLVIEDGDGVPAIRLEESAPTGERLTGRSVVLTDEDGNVALRVEPNGTVLVDGDEVATQ
jgi:hypothetical protein